MGRNNQQQMAIMNEKKPTLGLITLIALVTGNMIGSGIFLLPSNLASIGSISLYSWLFTTAGAVALTFVFANLSAKLPKTGGAYAYARATLGEFIGFQTAYHYWIAVWVGNAAIAVALVGYLQVFWPALINRELSCLVAIAVVWLLTVVNIMGVRSVGLMQLLTTVLKLIPIFIIGTMGWFYIHPNYYIENYNITSSHQSSFSAISAGAALTFWAFIGLESATVPADSVKNPKRNIPLATIIGTLIAAAIYIASSIAIMGMLPASFLQNSTSPFADAAKIIFGSWGREFIAAGAIISCFGCLNGWILLQGQIPMAAASDRLFPKFFAKCNSRGVPATGLIATSILISLLLLLTASENLVTQFEIIILLAVFASLIPYFYSTIAEMIFLRKAGMENKKSYLKMAIAIFAGLFAFWAIMSSGTKTIFYGVALLLSSVPLYAWHIKKKIISA